MLMQALYNGPRTSFEAFVWEEIDRRLIHALELYPSFQIQVIPFAEDSTEIQRYAGRKTLPKKNERIALSGQPQDQGEARVACCPAQRARCPP